MLLCASGGCAPVAAPSPSSVAAPSAPTSTPTAQSLLDDCAGESAVSVVHHAIDLSLGVAPSSLAIAISGQGDVRVRARRETTAIALDAPFLRVSEISTATGPLRYQHTGDRICITLPRALPAGAELTIHLVWEVPTDRDSPHVAADQIWAGYSASSWMPTLQDPAQRATLALRITAPADWKVAAAGQASSSPPVVVGDRITRSFTLERPSPPFLYAFAAGRFDEATLAVDGVTLRALGPASANLQGALAITAPMLRFLHAHTGAPFPGAEYTQVFVRGDAAQEAAGLALLSADALDEVRKDPTEDWIFSHELAHQWFAWMVPCADFSDFWLNEGFATFLVAAVKEERWGRPAYERELGLWRKRSAKVHADGRDAALSLSPPGAPPPPPPRESALQPRGVTYSRGALVLDKLRGELGDAVFWSGIRRYVNDRAGKGARSEDLRAALEAASGRDLRPFFARWVYASAPDL
ncbi:MAG: M1 family aminopeptidase [Byssovorax sp.]